MNRFGTGQSQKAKPRFLEEVQPKTVQGAEPPACRLRRRMMTDNIGVANG